MSRSDTAATTTQPSSRQAAGELLRVDTLVKHFPIHGGLLHRQVESVRAVDEVSFTLREGETLGLVGESGCGKSTVARLILRLLDPTSGRIYVNGQDITTLRGKALRSLRRDIQLVFQDPYSSLNPRKTIGSIIDQPLRIHGHSRTEALRRTEELLELVGLSPDHADRYPREFSGGQRQRIGIARALALRPKILVLDEPVSGLDVSIQAQIVNLLQQLQHELGLTYLFISHDLAVVRHISHRVAVMYLGKIAEIGDRRTIYDHPAHPYTQALLSAAPSPSLAARSRQRTMLEGDLPSPSNPPSGCRFRTRCPKAEQLCATEEPALDIRVPDGRLVACHFPLTTAATDGATGEADDERR